jgi:hypothetical protein
MSSLVSMRCTICHKFLSMFDAGLPDRDPASRPQRLPIPDVPGTAGPSGTRWAAPQLARISILNVICTFYSCISVFFVTGADSIQMGRPARQEPSWPLATSQETSAPAVLASSRVRAAHGRALSTNGAPATDRSGAQGG